MPLPQVFGFTPYTLLEVTPGYGLFGDGRIAPYHVALVSQLVAMGCALLLPQVHRDRGLALPGKPSDAHVRANTQVNTGQHMYRYSTIYYIISCRSFLGVVYKPGKDDDWGATQPPHLASPLPWQ